MIENLIISGIFLLTFTISLFLYNLIEDLYLKSKKKINLDKIYILF